jgi:hypothetical protein
MAIVDTIGWVATAVFASSYFFQRPDMLRGVQMLGATMWIVYGVLLAAPPVIAANALLIGVAAWTVYRSRRGAKDEPAGSVG